MEKEHLRRKSTERDADFFRKKYPEQINALESHSPLSKFRSVDAFDVQALGEQLQMYEMYQEVMNEAGTASDLGKLPQIALDVIAASFGASIAPIVASVQPIDEEIGIIYFKQVKAIDTRGNVTADQTFLESKAPPDVYPVGYAKETVSGSLGSTASGTTAYTGSLATQVRPNTFKGLVTVGSTVMRLVDDGEGNLLGNGWSGTINYTTGAWTIDFGTDPLGTYAMTLTYGTDYESGAQIPRINTELSTDVIQAEVYALQSDVGLLKNFSMRKRFGRAADDEMVSDLVNSITAEVNASLVSNIVANYNGSVNWNKTPSGISWVEHKLELKDVIRRAGNTIYNNAGRGNLTYMIAGSDAAGYISNLPGFVGREVNTAGPHVYGTLDGKIVIQAPDVTSTHIYPVYKGTGAFDAAIVYSPYMPLFVTGSIPTTSNYMKQTGLAAIWAGMKVVVPNFITRIVITSS